MIEILAHALFTLRLTIRSDIAMHLSLPRHKFFGIPGRGVPLLVGLFCGNPKEKKPAVLGWSEKTLLPSLL